MVFGYFPIVIIYGSDMAFHIFNKLMGGLE